MRNVLYAGGFGIRRQAAGRVVEELVRVDTQTRMPKVVVVAAGQ